MIKSELAKELSLKANISHSEALRSIEGLLEIMSNAFIKGNSIYLRGFGTFKIQSRGNKKSRNFSTGQTIILPPCKHLRFIPSTKLKNKVK